ERKEASAADYSKLWPGLEIAPIDAAAREELGLDKRSGGALVTSVIAKSPASTLGLKAGDVVTEVNGVAIGSVADYYRVLNDPKTQKFQFTVLRDGQTLTTLALIRK
ncbi:MAG TPA: PDZ domain-containing protein, partial [Spirochaetales bacterium]|nr:PDZ domain-containing protein [Spirochaetales bacterium]